MGYLREVESATGRPQDIFQTVVWGDPKTPAVGQRDLYDFEPASEAYPKISDVVELALLRGQLEQQLFDRNIPVNRWLDRFSKTMRRHPTMRPYGHIFNVAFYMAFENHQGVRQVWSQAHKDTISEPDLVDGRASSEAAAQLYKAVFGVDPKDKPRAIREQTMLGFVVSEQDYSALNELLGLPTNNSKGLYMDGPIPVMVLLDSDELQSTAIHETEHYKSHLFYRSMAGCNPDLLPPWIAKNLVKIATDPNVFAKEELLAWMSVRVGHARKGDSLRKVKGKIEEVGRRMQAKGFTLDERWREGLSDDQIARLAKDSTEAFFDTYSFFRTSDVRLRPGGMAINVLSQFRLTDWPIVVGMLKADRPVSASTLE